MEVHRVSEHLFQVRIEPPPPYDRVNVYVKLGDDGSYTLIDAGPSTGECLTQIREALSKLGLPLGRLGAVLLTHHHVDHAGLAGTLQKLTGCAVLVHTRDLKNVLDPVGRVLERFRGVVGELEDQAVKRMMDEALEVSAKRLAQYYSPVQPQPLPDGGIRGFRLVEAPGHTPGSVVYVPEGSSVGLCGDTVLDTLTLTIEDLSEYFGTLDRLAEHGFSALWPGHGGALEPAAKWVEAVRQKYSGRVRRVGEIIRQPKTLLEVAKELYGQSVDWGSPHSVSGNPALALIQTKTYLNYMVGRGLAETKTVGGRTLYTVRGGA